MIYVVIDINGECWITNDEPDQQDRILYQGEDQIKAECILLRAVSSGD
jgi:hypothetical protein